MSKKIKGIMEQEFKHRFEDVNEFMVVSLRGVGGNDNNDLRGELLSKQIEVKVVKNSLAVRAFGQLGIKGLEDIFVGPCAVIYGGDNIVDVAKEVAKWDKKLDKMEIKGGCIEGEVLDAERAKGISKMLTRAEQQGVVVQLALSPGSRLASAIGAPGSVIAGAIKALVEKLEEAA